MNPALIPAACPPSGVGLGAPTNPSIPPNSLNRPSYASAVRGNSINEEPNIAAKISSSDGVPTVTFESQDLAKAAFAFRFALVMKFSHSKRPSIEIIRNQVQRRWGIQSAVISLLDGRHVLLKCATETDMIRALSRENTRIEGMFYKISRWSPEFDLKQDASIASIWVQLKGLPPHLYPNVFLKNIAKPIGNFLRADNPTVAQTNTTRARFCVEVDLMHSLPEKINVNVSRSKVIQQVVTYEAIPNFCDGCMLQGHAKSECTKLNPFLRKEVNVVKENGKIVDPSILEINKIDKNQREWRKKNVREDNDCVECCDLVENDGIVEEEDELSSEAIPKEQLETAGQVFEEMPEPVVALGNGEAGKISAQEVFVEIPHSAVGEEIIQNGIIDDGNELAEIVNVTMELNNLVEDETVQHQSLSMNQSKEGNNPIAIESPIHKDLKQALDPFDLGLESPMQNRVGSSDDEELVPDSQVQLVKEASIVQGLLDGISTKKNKDDLKIRKLVAKISKKKIALLPAGPLKEKLTLLVSNEINGGGS